MIGAPGCARSPKENGFDWVLDRYLAGLDVSWEDITGMGVGGLLMEIESRPQPRATPSAKKRIAAVILAVGAYSVILSRLGHRPDAPEDQHAEP